MKKQRKITRVVVVGGGAGGLELVSLLSKRSFFLNKIDITLVDSNLTHIWKPLWHELAAGTLINYEDEINYIMHAYNNHYRFILGEMSGINREKRELVLARVVDEEGVEILPVRTVSYDILVIAIGSVGNDFSIDGVKEFCYLLDNRQLVEKFHCDFLNGILRQYSHNSSQVNEPYKIVIIGGGATGVELAAELHYAIAQLNRYNNIMLDVKNIASITIVEASSILSGLHKNIILGIKKFLKSHNIKICEKSRVKTVTAEGITLENNVFISAHQVIWTAGIKSPQVLRNLDGLECNPLNQLIVKPTLQTKTDENIFALGDCAYCLRPNGESQVPPRAQAAHQQAVLLNKSIRRYIKGKDLLTFDYHDYGSLISLSRYTAIGRFMGFRVNSISLEGRLAKLTYLALYKMHQVILLGVWQVLFLTLADLLTRHVKPQIKLH